MNAIETAVHARFASLQDAQRTQHISSASEPSTAIPAGILNSAAPEEGEGARPGIVETPFAKVASVAASSPAAGAGLKAGDKVRVFGGVNWMNHENLAGVARVVAGSEGVSYLLFLHGRFGDADYRDAEAFAGQSVPAE